MKFTDLKSHIAEGKLRSVYILMGDDDYLINSARKLFIASIKAQDFNYTAVPSERLDQVVDSLRIYPFLSDYRIVDISTDKEILGLKEYLKAPNPQSVLLLTLTKLEKYHKDILQYAEIIDCNRLDDRTLYKWIKAKVSELGSSINDSAIGLLISYCNKMMGKISDEVSKLSAYKYGEEITEADIKAMVTPDLEYKIFELGDAISKKDGERTISIYRELNYFNDTTKIFGVLYAHFRKLLYCAISPQEDLAALLGMNEYSLKIMKAQSKNFGALRLKNITDRMHDIDLGLKSGSLNDKTIVEGFLLEIILS